MRLREIVGVGLLLALTGCVSSGTSISDLQAAQFKKGVTTESQVVDKLGPPQSVYSGLDGSRTDVYEFTSSSPDAVDFVPIVGSLAGGATSKQVIVTFHFGPNSKLVGYTTNKTKVHVNTGIGG